MESGYDPDAPNPQPRLKRGTYAFYCVSFVLVAALTISGMAFEDIGETIVGIPMTAVLGLAIFADRKTIHVPPTMVIMVVAAFFLVFLGHTFSGKGDFLYVLGDFLTGVNLGLLGFIVVYILLKTLPGVRDENRAVVAFVAVCVAIASHTMARLLHYAVLSSLGLGTPMPPDEAMEEAGIILVGSVLVAVCHCFLDNNRVFGGVLNSFLETNSETLGMSDLEHKEILRIIDGGESSKTEFKSTLRTNLATGETDKRMEKAVTKTIVAFLNSDGGNLLIGVADDGSIPGADVASFENKDKMGLHLSNLISSQIGAQFLPYISFVMTDFEDATVIRVKCSPCGKPVFLKEGKTETFYVRKGPQSDELSGMALINYVNNRKRKTKR